MSLTPPHQLPTIKEGSTVGFRFNVGTWCAVVACLIAGLVTLIGFVRWLDAMHADVQALKGSQEKAAQRAESQDATLRRIEETCKDIDLRQRYGITAGLPAPVKANP